MQDQPASRIPHQPPRRLDRQSWSTLLAGGLLLLISFTTNDSDDHLLLFRQLPAAHQIGVGSTLPPWQRSLAALSWRPVDDIEQRTRQLELRALESEKRLKLLRKENERLAALESRMDPLLRNADSSSQTPPATGSN